MLKPRGDRILVRRAEEQYKGKIVIPDAMKEKIMEAHVVEIGPGRFDTETGKRIPIDDLMIGDKVLIGKYVGSEVEVDGEKFVVLRDEEILGRFEA